MSPKNVTSAELLRAKQNLARGGSDLPYTPNLADGILAGEFGPAIVIDNGSSLTKAGPAGFDAPAAVFRTIIGQPVEEQAMANVDDKCTLIGTKAWQRQATLELRYPVEHGIIVNWKDMEQIWDHTFRQELRIDPTGQTILLSEAPGNPKLDREKSCDLFFDRFGVQALNISLAPVLSLIGTGRTTGLVVESGDAVTHTVPVSDGSAVKTAIFRHDAAGRDVTSSLVKAMAQEGTRLTSLAELLMAQKIKEGCCYCADSVNEELMKPVPEIQETYDLPDGNSILIKQSRFLAPECMFNPQEYLGLESQEAQGLHQHVLQSIAGCDIGLAKILRENIILSGGNTLLSGFEGRLKNEIMWSMGTADTINVYVPPERKYLAWIGGSVLASLSTFQQMVVTKVMFEEEGSAAIHKYCP